MKHLLSKRVSELAASATIAMAEKARALKAQGKNVISLSLGEPDFDTPKMIKNAAKLALDNGYTKYTPVPGHLELREAICKKLADDNDLSYDPSQIVVSNGAKQSIANVCMALVNPGDEVIIFAPYWVSYEQIAQIAGAKVVPVLADIHADFKVTADQLRAAMSDKTKLIIFSSPCNPTGSVYSETELRELGTVIADHPNLMVVSDEIYEYIQYGSKHFSIAQVEEIHDRVILVNGFSKAYSMTGWRLGYMAAHVDLAEACAKIQSQCTSGATSFGQKAAVSALADARDEARIMKDAFAKRRTLMYDLLSDIPDLGINLPEGAFYFFPDASKYYGRSYKGKKILGSVDLCEYLLEEALVATVPGIAFGHDNYFRLSYAVSEQELQDAAERIKKALAKLQ